MSCGADKTVFLHCLAVGMCFNAARLVQGTQSGGFGSTKSGPSMTISSKGNKSFVRDGKASSSGLAIGVIEAPYTTMRGGQLVHIHPSSVLFAGSNSRKLPPYVIYAELLITSKQYMRGVTSIDGEWLVGTPFFKKRELVHAGTVAPTTTATSSSHTQMSQSNKAYHNNNPSHAASNPLKTNHPNVQRLIVAGVSSNASGNASASHRQWTTNSHNSDKFKLEPNATMFSDDDHVAKKRKK